MDEKQRNGTCRFIINIPKKKVIHTKNTLQSFGAKHLKVKPKKLFTELSQTSLTKYIFADQKPVPVKVLEKYDLLLSYSFFTKEQRNYRRKQSVAIKLCNRYKIVNINLRNRLYIEDVPHDVCGIKDINEDFFNDVEGRPLTYRPEFKALKFMFLKLIRLRQEIGYRKDIMFNIDFTHKREQEKYDLCSARCKEQIKSFDAFISFDHQKSMFLLAKCEDMKVKVKNKNIELQNLASDSFWIMSRLIVLDSMFGHLQNYGKFLYFISPLSWRSKHREFGNSMEMEQLGFENRFTNDADSFGKMFEKLSKICFSGNPKPVLYFDDPKHLIDALNKMEQQQHNHYSYVTQMAPLSKFLTMELKAIRGAITQESITLVQTVKRYENQVHYCQNRIDESKATFFKVLHGIFYQSVGEIDVLKLYTHLQFICEKVLVELPVNLDIVSMAKELENQYLKYRLLLDSMQGEDVQNAIDECMKQEKLKFKKSNMAARELRNFERMKNELLLCYEPVPKNIQKYVHPKLKKNKTPKIDVKDTETKLLSEEELEYLNLFTEWRENEDSAKYLEGYKELEQWLNNDPKDSQKNKKKC